MIGLTTWKRATVLVLAAALLGTSWAWWLHGLGSESPAYDDGDRVDIPTANLPHKGAAPATARVTMLECSDYTCPYCERASHTVDELIARNDDLGFYHLHAPLRSVGPGARAAVAAAAAQRQGAFWPMHDALFHTRIDSDRTAIDLARSLDLDPDRFATDLVDPALHTEVARQRTLCTEAGVRGVPTFFINGRRFVGAQPIEAFQRVIDEERR
jgi:protein-disulfide isomerase